MKGKRILVVAAVAAGMMALNGCEMLSQDTWEPQEPDAISIDKDGGITEYIQEELNEAYYDATELQNMIDSEVSSYNAEHGESAVKVSKYEAADGRVNLTMEYATAADYAQFNNVEFYYGSMINAQIEGYLFDASYKKVQNGVVEGSAVSGSEVIKELAQQVLVVKAPLEVHVPGTVLYTSTNAEVRAADVVNATGDSEEEEEEGLVLPSNAVYRGEEASLEEQEAANRVYIIFEMD